MAVAGQYSFTTKQGVTFQVLSTGLLTSASDTTDFGLFTISTTSTGAAHLPFPVTVYNAKYTSMVVSADGNIEMGTTGTEAFTNQVLPTPDFQSAALCVYWDDLWYDPSNTSNGAPQGIYTQVSGTKPHRTFIISFQGTIWPGNTTYQTLAQVVFKEGSLTIRYRYGAPDDQSATLGVNGSASETIGTQGPGGRHGHSTTVTVNPGSPGAIQAGEQITFTHYFNHK